MTIRRGSRSFADQCVPKLELGGERGEGGEAIRWAISDPPL